MAGIDNASKFRSKEDEERLRRQKAKAPTDINRARELAKQYSNPHKFSNTVTTKQTVREDRWYSGDKPTARETYARMYQVAGNDQNKMKELQGQYAQEISNPGSVIYNPYAQATNTKAINGLRELGIDVPDVITDQWVDKMWGQYGQYGRQTTTSYGPSAPTTKSTRENDIAYWVSTLMEDKEDTNLAEAQMKSLYDEVAYLTKQGYSDNEIVKRVRNEFGSKYNVLNKMDEERMVGSAVRLNRAVDYSGDDTLYGMIWAARNDGGTGDYFTDAVNYAMGNGKKYKADPTSEAALDPTSPDYNPYGRGGTMHELQMKYGVDKFDRDWLDKNRATILSDPDGYKDIEKIQGSIEDYEKATAELAELDKWVEKQIARGATAEDINAELDALIKAGGDEYGLIKVPTLKKMEDKRYAGTYLGLADAVDFTMPGYLDKVADKIAERDVGAVVQEEENEQREASKLGKWLSEAGAGVSRFFASMDIGIGSHGDAIDSVLDAEHGSMSTDDMVKKYASSQLGVELTGDLQDGEREIVESVLEQIDAATKFGASKEEREAAAAGIAVLDQLVGQIAADPERRDSYKANESYTSVYDKQPEELREGMAPMTAEPMAYTSADGQPVDPYSMPEAGAYEQMLQGGEWDTNALGWGYSMSNNPTAIEAELVEGILGIFNGQKPTGLSKSWYNEFSGLMNNTNKAVRPTGLSQGERDIHAANPELYDSRHMYGSQVYDALMANQKALDDGALHPVDYVKNLVVISAAAEAIGEAAGGARATDELAAEVLAANNGELQAMLDSANGIAAQGQEAKAAAEAEVQQKIIGVVDAYAAGEQLDMKSETVMNSILSMDISQTAADDSTYQDISAQVKDSLSMDNLLRSGMTFTTGDFETDMLMDHADLQQSGALVYGQGVMMVVEDMLDEDMRLASACGMTLGEYYEAHPERARSSEQMLAEAQTRYDTTWNEFGKTISGLTAANQKLEGNEEGAKISTVESLSLKDTIGVIADKFGIQLEADLRKTGHFLNYAWRDQGQKKNALMQQYGNDRTAYNADLNELEKGELTRLQGVYENDASKGDMQFYEWVKQHPEGQNLRELQAMREASVDIFDIGMTVDEIKSGWGIADVTGTMANIDALVEEHGSDADKFIVQSGVSLLNTGLMMATTALGGGGIAGSLAATAANAGASAHDRFQQTGNFDAALWSSVAEWGVNVIIEKIGFDRYMPEGIGGGNLATKMMHSKYILATQNLAQIVRSPESMSKVARGIFAAGIQGLVDAGSEFMEEFSQGIVSAMADNFAYSKPYLLTAKQFGEAAKEGIMAAVTAPILSLASGNKISFSDAAGNLIDSAQALLLPEHDGAILNDAIDFQSTRLAIQNSQDALNQIEQSSENAAKKQAGADLQAANAELAEAQAELATVQEQEATAGAALDAANAEMNNGQPFTEELSKRMVAAAENVNKVREHLAKVQQRVQAASDKQAEAQQKYEDAKAAVQKMYDELMQTAKAEAEQLVTDMFFGGDSEAQRAAMDRYRTACQKLMDAKNNLRIARADSEMFARGTTQGDGLFEYFGEALLEVEALTEEVAAAKAEVDAAYAATGEAQMQAQQNADLARAEQVAMQAAEAAAADPTSANKQAQAKLAQAQVDAMRAKQAMDEKRTDIGRRLQSPRTADREAAVQEWNVLQSEATAAASEADRLQAEADMSDTQKNLRTAIENMQQYNDIDLTDESSENHEAAMDAYAELQAASEDAELEQALNGLSKAMENPENAEEITNATRKVDELRSRKKESQPNQAPVKHIDDRTPFDVSDKNMQPFFNSNRETFKDYVLATAKIIRSDVQNSTAAQRIFVEGGAGNGMGSDQLVIGQARNTTELIGKYMDISKWSWKKMGDYLDRFITALETDKPLPNTVYIKRIEMMVNEALTDGYTDLEGIRVPPAYNYRAGKTAIDGRQYADTAYENDNGESFYDMTGAGSPITPSLVEAAKDISAAVHTRDGRYVLEVGNKFVYTDGNAENPQISEVVTLTVPDINPDLEKLLKETVYHAYDEGVYTDGVWETLHSIFERDTGSRDSVRHYDARVSEAGSGRAGGAAGGPAGGASGKGPGGVSPESNIRAWRDTGAGFGDHRGPGRTGEVTIADRNPIEIMSDLTRSIQAGYNPGGEMSAGGRRMPRAVMAFYNHHAQSITSRTSEAGDLAISLHEFGHAVQDRLPGVHANQQLINNLPQDVRNAYDPAEWDGEAFAEFVVDYIFNRDEAVRMAGDQFVRDFEDALRADRPLYNAVMDASHQTELWNNADIGSKVGSMTKDSSDPRRGQIGNWLQRTARRIETAVADLTAPADMVSRDFRRRALYAMHASRRADVALSRFLIDPNGRNIGQSLAERFYRAGVTEADQAEVSRYALARHALDRRMQNKDVFDEHEFPTAELEAYVANAPDNIVAGADALTSFWSDFMDAWWVQTGMIDADAVAEMRAMYPHYVPTFRVMGENFNQYGGQSSRFQVRRAVEGGSSLEVIDPLVSIVKMTQQMVSTVTQNQLMQAFHNEMRQGGLGFIADDVTQQFRVQRNDTTALQNALDAIRDAGADPALMDDAYAAMLDLQERWIGTGQNYGPNVVSGMDENGNRFFYQIKDRDLFRLLSGTANRSADMGSILRVARNFKNTFTALTTSSNPLFALKNMQRDIQASVNTGTHSLTYAGGVARMVGALYDIATGNQTFRDWQAMGGGEHTRFSTELGDDAGRTTRNLARGLMRGRETRRGEFRNRSTAGDRIMNVLTWEKLNNAVENASRYMEYKYGRHDLTSDEGRREAFMASQDVTTNFGTHGASGVIRVLNQVVPFMNATIQGLNKDINIIRDIASGDQNLRRQAMPKLAKTVMNTALTAMLQYGLLKMFGGDEDDEDYALLSQEMRLGNLIIPIPKAAMEVLGDQIGFDKPYIRIPMAQGPMAQSAYAMMLDTVSNVSGYTEMEIDLWKAAKTILTDVIPDGTVFQGLIDARNNRTWYGGEIESEYQRNYSVENRYDADTPQMFVAIGKRLGVSPAKLEYLANQYTGFAGKLMIPFASRDRFNPDADWSLGTAGKNVAYSVLKNYTIDPVSSNDLSSSYSTAKDTINQIVADGKAGKPMNNLGYTVDADEAFGAAQYLSKEFAALDKEISALWGEYNDIKASNLDDGEKARQMRALRRDQIIPLQQDAMALYEEFKMQYIDCDTLAMEIAGLFPWGLDRPTLD